MPIKITSFVADTKIAIHLHLLPYLIPPKSRTKITTKKHWKFSAAEVLQCFYACQGN